MSVLADSLRRARELYLSRAHLLIVDPSVVDVGGLLGDACQNVEVVLQAWELLDQCSPGGSFARYADGGRVAWDGDFISVTYAYDRRPAEVAAVIGKACVLAEAMPEPPKRRFATPPPAPAVTVASAETMAFVKRELARERAGYVQDPEEEERDDG